MNGEARGLWDESATSRPQPRDVVRAAGIFFSAAPLEWAELIVRAARKGIVALIDNGTMVEDTQLIFLKAHFPSAYTKLKGLPFVGAYAHDFEQDVWVFFQWDTKPQYVRPLANDGA